MNFKNLFIWFFLNLILFHAQRVFPQVDTKFIIGFQPKGVWEGEIFDSKRPIVTRIDFDNKNIHFDTSSDTPWALSISSLAADQVEFSTKAGQFTFEFRGKYLKNKLDGTVNFAGKHFAFSIRKLPETVTPFDRVQAWKQDIDQLLSRFINYDKSFSHVDQQTFRRRLQKLSQNIKNLPDQAIEVEIAKDLALARNGHTRLYLLRNRTEVRQIPIRVWWFKNRLYIIRADSQYRSALGCEIKKIGSLTVQSAYSKVMNIDAGSSTWKRYMSSYFLTSPDILFGVGILPASDIEQLTISRNGKEEILVIPALPLKKTKKPDEVWRDLSPIYDDKGLISAYVNQTIPLYLQHPNDNYWFEYLPDSKIIYLQYNRAQKTSDINSPEHFKDSVARIIKERNPRALIFDLRFNTGGDGFLAEPLIRTIADQRPKIPVFVITGRATFSAGIMAAAQLHNWANAVLVGEKPGDASDFWAEGGNLILSNSGLAAHYANGFHNYSTKSYPGLQPFVKLMTASLLPSLPANATWKEYISGRDIALELILKSLFQTN